MIKKAKVLLDEMLPYILKFKDKIVVIKYGGNAMVGDNLKKGVMKDIAFLKAVGLKPVIVHGGGPFVTNEMKKANLEQKFIHGLRVTDEATIKIATKVFEDINDDIQSMLHDAGVIAQKVECLIARQKGPELGYVGEITYVDIKSILKTLDDGKVAVISPIGDGVEDKEQKYNINADTAATKIAMALGAEKLTILTNVDGIEDNGKILSHLSKDDAHKLIEEGIITGGMIPKVKACIQAVDAGCKKAHVINGTILYSLLFEIFTDKGIGTEVVKDGY